MLPGALRYVTTRESMEIFTGQFTHCPNSFTEITGSGDRRGIVAIDLNNGLLLFSPGHVI